MKNHLPALLIAGLLPLGIGCQADNATVDLDEPAYGGEAAGGIPPRADTDPNLPVASDSPVGVQASPANPAPR